MTDNTPQPAAEQREIGFEELCSQDFWRPIGAELSLMAPMTPGMTTSSQTGARISQRLMRDGYFGEVDPLLGELAPRIAAVVSRLAGMGLPPAFAFLFDEPWSCFFRLAPVVAHLLGPDYKVLPDCWAWHVDPQKPGAPPSPRRDRGSKALAADGSPLSLTVWIPLTIANPLNSCIYMLPSHLDPGYGQEDAGAIGEAALLARALPVTPGQYLAWNQAVLHWDSNPSEFADGPRMSMALEFQRGDIAAFNNPLLEQGFCPDFDYRLKLIAQQLLQRQATYGFSDSITGLAGHILSRV